MKRFVTPSTYTLLHRGLKAYLEYVQHPDDAENIVNISSLQNIPILLEAWSKFIQSCPELMSLYEENYQPSDLDFRDLLALPDETVGHIFAQDMLSQGLDPDFALKKLGFEGNSPLDYIQNLRMKTHDWYHIVTGFDTSIAGELGVAMVYFSQLRAPSSSIVIGATIAHCALEPDWYFPVMNALNCGQKIGENSKNLLTIKWEKEWAKPLKTLQQELGIIPADSNCSSAALEKQHHRKL